MGLTPQSLRSHSTKADFLFPGLHLLVMWNFAVAQPLFERRCFESAMLRGRHAVFCPEPQQEPSEPRQRQAPRHGSLISPHLLTYILLIQVRRGIA